MPALMFFPWLTTLSASIDAGEFELVPYHRSTEHPQRVEDLLLSHYRRRPNHPIGQATLMRPAGSSTIGERDEDVVRAAYSTAQFITLAGLSRRRFFDQLGYWNADNFQLVVQRFDNPSGGVTIQTRRRDGHGLNLTSDALYSVVMPEHVHATRVEVDQPLLRALCAASSMDDASALIESVVSYNLANTDGLAVQSHVELVLMMGAVQTLLDASSSIDNIVPRFIALWPVTPTVGPERLASARRAGRDDSRRASLVEVWLRDAYALRGDLAHGRVAQRYPSRWSLPEHLLLLAFVFPLLVKAKLTALAAYALTDSDRTHCGAFEHLLTAENLFQPTDDGGDAWPWNEILASYSWSQVVNPAIAEAVAEALADADDDDARGGDDEPT